jgi:integrase/recombinase XerD
MARGKQAKILTDKQIKAVLAYISANRRYPKRDKVIFLLSYHGLRAKECSEITLSMVTDAEGNIADVISLDNSASKGKSGRIIPMSETLKQAISEYLEERGKEPGALVKSERGNGFSAASIAEWFHRLYAAMGYEGASSHSGRRSFITNAARKIPLCGGSLLDVMALAGHRHLSTTQAYISDDTEAQKKVVDLLFAAIYTLYTSEQ